MIGPRSYQPVCLFIQSMPNRLIYSLVLIHSFYNRFIPTHQVHSLHLRWLSFYVVSLLLTFTFSTSSRNRSSSSGEMVLFLCGKVFTRFLYPFFVSKIHLACTFFSLFLSQNLILSVASKTLWFS